jgi:cytochrome c-type biogenesis protein CcmH/NrfG
MRRTVPLTLLVVVGLAWLPSAGCSRNYGSPEQPSSQLAFGVSMAQQGLWSEALFRFRQAERAEPDNPHVLNNLGVAYEASGNFEQALASYQKALKIAPDNREVRANYARFVEFYQSFRPKGKDGKPLPAPAPAPGAAPRTQAAPPAPPPASP